MDPDGGFISSMFDDDSLQVVLNQDPEEMWGENYSEIKAAHLLSDNSRATFQEYPVLANSLTSNISTGRVLIVTWYNEETGKLEQVANPRYKNLVCGGQLYSPLSRNFLMQQVKKWEGAFRKLPAIFMELMTWPSPRKGAVDDQRKMALCLLNEMESIIHFFLEQLKKFRNNHARFEGYFDISGRVGSIQWPETALQPSFVRVKTEDLEVYVKEMSANTFRSLRTILTVESQRPRGESLSPRKLPYSAKICILHKCEKAVELLTSGEYTSVITKNIPEEERNDANEVPVHLRTPLTTDVMNWTGLKYGLASSLLTVECHRALLSGGDRPLHEPSHFSSTPLRYIVAADFQGVVFVPFAYIEHFNRLRSLYNQYHLYAQYRLTPRNDGPPLSFHEWEEAENPKVTYFHTWDEATMARGLDELDVKQLFKYAARILLSMYKTEWHYHICTPKKRFHRNWPQQKNTLDEFFSNGEQLREFINSNPRCEYVNLPRGSEPEVKVESKWQNRPCQKKTCHCWKDNKFWSTFDVALSMLQNPQFVRL
jgi:hypothetical protein